MQLTATRRGYRGDKGKWSLAMCWSCTKMPPEWQIIVHWNCTTCICLEVKCTKMRSARGLCQCSICQKSSGGRATKARESRRRKRRGGVWFFHFKIMHSAAFSYTNSKVLFAIKCRERYVITVLLAIDGDEEFSSIS